MKNINEVNKCLSTSIAREIRTCYQQVNNDLNDDKPFVINQVVFGGKMSSSLSTLRSAFLNSIHGDLPPGKMELNLPKEKRK